jgi:hypothetical protein
MSQDVTSKKSNGRSEIRKSCFFDLEDELDKELMDLFFPTQEEGKKARGFYHPAFGNVRLGDSDLFKFCLRHAKKTLIDVEEKPRVGAQARVETEVSKSPPPSETNNASSEVEVNRKPRRSLGNLPGVP